MERFTVRHRFDDEPSYWFTVAVYDTAAELQSAASRHRPAEIKGFWDNCAGCFQPSDSDSRYLGIMRLCREQMTADTVIHESVHAAITFTRKSRGLKALHLHPYSSLSMQSREEPLAHAVNGIACALLRHLNVTL